MILQADNTFGKGRQLDRDLKKRGFKSDMQTEKVDTIIIGGGLSGIYTAFLLAAKQKSLVLLEARSRVGGRILSPEHQGFFADLARGIFHPNRPFLFSCQQFHHGWLDNWN